MPGPERVIHSIIAQHAEEASFLWCQRAIAIRSRVFSIDNLAGHDDRLGAHIDGLRVAGDWAARACKGPLESGEPGAMFAPTILALESGQRNRIEELLSLADAASPIQLGLISAFGWVSAYFLRGTANELLGSESPFRRRVGVACCAMHRVDPGLVNRGLIRDVDQLVRARALRSAGEIGQKELASPLAALTEDDSECQFWASWSAVLLGDRHRALDVVVQTGLVAGPHRPRAFQLGLQAMDAGAAHKLLQRLAADPKELRWLIQGSGIAGDPKYVPWLIKHMAGEETARISGEAFSLITGVDLRRAGLRAQQPKNLDSGPSDDPDDPSVEMDPDDELPWPDPERIEHWWGVNAARFQRDTRYFLGAPVTHERCIEVLRNGYQRQRILAAQYLCLREPGTPLFNTAAPAGRQQTQLARMN
jgi:uncharacterized protein (TIGR02270 family)